MFTKFDKAIAAGVLALLAILSQIFKTDLSVYADLVTILITSIIPLVVYYVPNLKVIEDGQNEGAEKALGAVESIFAAIAKKYRKGS